jgi:Domain of unknown function (DUF4286)
MLLYNVTIKVENNIADAWLQWMKDEHIPDVINTGCFTKATLCKLLEVDDEDGPTYTVQYLSATDADYQRYINEHAPVMRKKVTDKWGNNIAIFRSLMLIVH